MPDVSLARQPTWQSITARRPVTCTIDGCRIIRSPSYAHTASRTHHNATTSTPLASF